MKDDLESVGGPIQRLQNFFEKKKMKLKIQESLHTAIHLHDTQHALRQPKAEIFKFARSLLWTFWCWKSRKSQILISIAKFVAQA